MTTLTLKDIEREMDRLAAMKEQAVEQAKVATMNKVSDVLSNDPIASVMKLVTKFLNQTGSVFEITMPDGAVYVSKIVPAKKTANSKGSLAKYPRGEVANYIEKQLRDAGLLTGAKCIIRNDRGYETSALRQATSQTAYKVFGKGNYEVTFEDGVVWVKRLA